MPERKSAVSLRSRNAVAHGCILGATQSLRLSSRSVRPHKQPAVCHTLCGLPSFIILSTLSHPPPNPSSPFGKSWEPQFQRGGSESPGQSPHSKPEGLFSLSAVHRTGLKDPFFLPPSLPPFFPSFFLFRIPVEEAEPFHSTQYATGLAHRHTPSIQMLSEETLHSATFPVS